MNKTLNKRVVIVNIRNSLKRFYVDESSQNYDELKEGMKDVYTIQGNLDE